MKPIQWYSGNMSTWPEFEDCKRVESKRNDYGAEAPSNDSKDLPPSADNSQLDQCKEGKSFVISLTLLVLFLFGNHWAGGWKEA